MYSCIEKLPEFIIDTIGKGYQWEDLDGKKPIEFPFYVPVKQYCTDTKGNSIKEASYGRITKMEKGKKYI